MMIVVMVVSTEVDPQLGLEALEDDEIGMRFCFCLMTWMTLKCLIAPYVIVNDFEHDAMSPVLLELLMMVVHVALD